EYGVPGLEFGDLGRRGCLFKARVARKVGIVGIDQADRYALRGEFEGPNIEVFQLLRRKQYKATTPVSHAGDVVIEIEMRCNRRCIADPHRWPAFRRRQVKPVLKIETRQVCRYRQ